MQEPWSDPPSGKAKEPPTEGGDIGAGDLPATSAAAGVAARRVQTGLQFGGGARTVAVLLVAGEGLPGHPVTTTRAAVVLTGELEICRTDCGTRTTPLMGTVLKTWHDKFA